MKCFRQTGQSGNAKSLNVINMDCLILQVLTVLQEIQHVSEPDVSLHRSDSSAGQRCGHKPLVIVSEPTTCCDHGASCNLHLG